MIESDMLENIRGYCADLSTIMKFYTGVDRVEHINFIFEGANFDLRYSKYTLSFDIIFHWDDLLVVSMLNQNIM